MYIQLNIIIVIFNLKTMRLIYASNPSSPGALAWWKPSCIEDAKTCKAFKDYDWWLWQITFSDVLAYSQDLHAQSHGFLQRYSPCIGENKSNQQLFFMKKVGCRCQSLRQFCLTSAAALWWNRMHECINKSETVLVDSCWCISFWNWKKTRYQGSQRTNTWELGCAMLEIPAPLRALLFHHPQRI